MTHWTLGGCLCVLLLLLFFFILISFSISLHLQRHQGLRGFFLAPNLAYLLRISHFGVGVVSMAGARRNGRCMYAKIILLRVFIDPQCHSIVFET